MMSLLLLKITIYESSYISRRIWNKNIRRIKFRPKPLIEIGGMQFCGML